MGPERRAIRRCPVIGRGPQRLISALTRPGRPSPLLGIDIFDRCLRVEGMSLKSNCADTPSVPNDQPKGKAQMNTSVSAPIKARPSAQETLALWKKYRETNDPALRDRLILTFAPLVKFIVYRKVREMPARCEVEDFISCGLEALIMSIDRYDPAKGATLEQYVWTRIHGAVLDELRRMDWAPRSVRRWERDMDKAVEEFTVLHGRRPSNDELADSMGVTVAELRKRRDEIATSDLTSLNTLVLSDDD